MSDLSNMQRTWGYRYFVLSVISEFPHLLGHQGAQLVVATQEELGRPQVMTALEDLVTRGASGVLEVAGSPSGSVYLDGGRIAFARASWVPGLAARLRAISPELAGPGEMSSGSDEDDTAVAGFAVQGGYLTAAGLQELIRSIVVDAFLVLTIPLAMDSPVAAIRFTSTRTYWTEMFPRLAVGLVREEALRRAERLAEQGLAPTTAVALCDLRAPSAVLTREQWAVACRIGAHASALDLAARRGAALIDTLECLGSLTRAGLCAPVRASGRGQPPSRVPGRGRQNGPSSQPPAQPESTGRLPPRYPAQDYPGWTGGSGEPPSVEILRQVLNGLKKLS
jgi:hypothetical protein